MLGASLGQDFGERSTERDSTELAEVSRRRLSRVVENFDHFVNCMAGPGAVTKPCVPLNPRPETPNCHAACVCESDDGRTVTLTMTRNPPPPDCVPHPELPELLVCLYPVCLAIADLDHDGDVDLADYAELTLRASVALRGVQRMRVPIGD